MKNNKTNQAIEITEKEASKYKDRKIICSVTQRMIFENTHYSKDKENNPS